LKSITIKISRGADTALLAGEGILRICLATRKTLRDKDIFEAGFMGDVYMFLGEFVRSPG